MHLVGHSLGGKVAAVAALQLAELNLKEEEALEKQREGMGRTRTQMACLLLVSVARS